jgi:hypothetical protein
MKTSTLTTAAELSALATRILSDVDASTNPTMFKSSARFNVEESEIAFARGDVAQARQSLLRAASYAWGVFDARYAAVVASL